MDLPLHQVTRLFEIKGFDNGNPTVLYIHGFIETAQQESVQVTDLFLIFAILFIMLHKFKFLLHYSSMNYDTFIKRLNSNWLYYKSVSINIFIVVMILHITIIKRKIKKNRKNKTAIKYETITIMTTQ